MYDLSQHAYYTALWLARELSRTSMQCPQKRRVCYTLQMFIWDTRVYCYNPMLYNIYDQIFTVAAQCILGSYSLVELVLLV